jgi:hypothetical protein
MRGAGLRLRLGRSPFSSGADINKRPNDGTCESFSHSSYKTTTASRRPWRVMMQDVPRTASSTMAESAALASLNWISFKVTTVAMYAQSGDCQASTQLTSRGAPTSRLQPISWLFTINLFWHSTEMAAAAAFQLRIFRSLAWSQRISAVLTALASTSSSRPLTGGRA